MKIAYCSGIGRTNAHLYTDKMSSVRGLRRDRFSSRRRHLNSARHCVEGDRCPGGGSVKRDRPVPHIRGKQDKPTWHGLDCAAHGLQGGLERRFSKLDPALLGRFLLHDVWDRHIIAGADPALRVDMIGVETAIMQPRRPGSGKSKAGSATAIQGVAWIILRHARDIDADRFLDAPAQRTQERVAALKQGWRRLCSMPQGLVDMLAQIGM